MCRYFDHQTPGLRPGTCVYRQHCFRQMLTYERQSGCRNQFSSGLRPGKHSLCQCMAFNRRLHIRQIQPDQCARCGKRIELHGGRGNEPQCTFGPDKQLFEIVAGIIFA